MPTHGSLTDLSVYIFLKRTVNPASHQATHSPKGVCATMVLAPVLDVATTGLLLMPETAEMIMFRTPLTESIPAAAKSNATGTIRNMRRAWMMIGRPVTNRMVFEILQD